MNADTRTPHLDLGDLIAEVTGEATGDRVREHLAGCAQCRLEAERWSLVADGVRGLAADVPEVAGVPEATGAREVAEPVQPQRTARRVLAAPERRVMAATPRRRLALVASAAAAVVLVGFAAYGLSTVVSVHAPGSAGTGTTATLTAVTGCATLAQATGTLQQVNGDSLVIRTAGGQQATVTTTATTRLNASGPMLDAITDGAPVTVAGKNSGGAIAADFVAVGRPTLNVPGYVIVQGTVSDATATGFTVVTPAGTRDTVTTSGRTVVTVGNASLGQLRAGARTIAVGYPGPDGTLSAIAVFQPVDWLPGAHAEVTVKDCSPASIDHTIMALTFSG